MKYRTLGKANLRVSVIGIGTWQLGGEWGKDFTQGEVDQMFDAAKRPVFFTMFDDARGQGFADAGQHFQFRGRRGVDIDSCVLIACDYSDRLLIACRLLDCGAFVAFTFDACGGIQNECERNRCK